jgi:hypothetical protein
MSEPPSMKPPKELDAIVDLVFAYKTKAKMKQRKNRKKIHGHSSDNPAPPHRKPD